MENNHVKLKALRALNRHTQRDVAEAMRISHAAYNRKENGFTDFMMSEILFLMEFYSVKFEDIFNL
jgi:DNA-binding XRE family transcriptional regulator